MFFFFFFEEKFVVICYSIFIFKNAKKSTTFSLEKKRGWKIKYENRLIFFQ